MRFKQAAGRNRVEKEEEACTGCSMFESKPVQIETVDIDDEDAELMFEIVADIRRRRDSGEGLHLTKVSMLEWKLVLIWDSVVESNERNLRIYSKLSFEALQSWNEFVAMRLVAG